MLTPEQETWLAHLSDTDTVQIHPADPQANEKFEKVKQHIQSILGGNIKIVHQGATSLGISGQGEIDIYIPTGAENFDSMVGSMENIFGKPRSLYPMQRARFVTSVEGTKAEVFVINENTKGWVDGCKFYQYLRENPETLEAYRKLKEKSAGLSTQQYYRRKVEFINDVLAVA